MADNGVSNPKQLPVPPVGWQMKIIQDLCINVTSGGTPSRSNPEFYQNGIYSWFKTQELEDRVLFESEEKITATALEKSSAKLFPKNTVLMAMYGDGKTITSVGILAVEAATNQACCAMIPDQNICDPRFLFYALKYHRNDLIRIASGGAQRNLSGKLIRCFAINMPPLQEQHAIAHILGTLDDKIELNRQMKMTLEEIARVLFKSWFVNFDPVRAKSQGRTPNLPKTLYDLFPDSFENAEMGKIPKGWRVGILEDFISRRVERVGNQEAMVLSAIATGKLVKSDEHFNKRVYSKEISNYLLVEQWDFAYNPSRINIGSVGMLEESIVGAVSPAYVVIRPKLAYRWFLEFLLREANTKQWINVLASGSVRQSLSYVDFASIQCVIPPEKVVFQFNEYWNQLGKCIQSCSDEMCTLSNIRDTLLPKIISGELRIRDPVKFLKEARL